MSYTDPQRLEAAFFQRNSANEFYEEINISGSDLIVYLDENGKINADKVSVWAIKYNISSGSGGSSSLSSSYALTSSYAFQSVSASYFSGSQITASSILVGTILPLGSSIGSLLQPFNTIYANNFLGTASIALTASFALNAGASSPSASWASQSLSASFATSASFVNGTHVGNTTGTASWSSNSTIATSASFASASISSSFATTATTARSASWASSSLSASFSSGALSLIVSTSSFFLPITDAEFQTSWVFIKDTPLGSGNDSHNMAYITQCPSGSPFYNGLLTWQLDITRLIGTNFKQTIYLACSSSVTQSFSYYIGGQAFFIDRLGTVEKFSDSGSISFSPGITFKTASYGWTSPSSSMVWHINSGQGSASLHTDTIYILATKIENW